MLFPLPSSGEDTELVLPRGRGRKFNFLAGKKTSKAAGLSCCKGSKLQEPLDIEDLEMTDLSRN